LIAECYSRILLTYLRQGDAGSAGAYLDRVILPHLDRLPALTDERAAALAAWISLAEVARGKAQSAETWAARASSSAALDAETHIALAHALAILQKYEEADHHAARAIAMIRSEKGMDTWFVVPQLITRNDIARLRGDRQTQQRFALEAWELFHRNGSPGQLSILGNLCGAMRDAFGRKAPPECKTWATEQPKAVTVEVNSLRR
jgi:tetratricopeptide (TPR) repeat protein